ncbi:hypothetical protein M231_05513 [Tremella mesenterica]|uniref:Uncharacterized protein n=1 Tax=Tremella mesenterica TaxID=5217 RepID=A0A4Q1BHX1_TREME|nr:hypothetical protein M231_05513 [Tremella mesenterica]
MFVDHLSTVPELDNAFKKGVNFPNDTKKHRLDMYQSTTLMIHWPLQCVAINYNPIISVFYAKEWDSTSTSRRWIIFGSTRLIPTLLHFHLLVPTRLARSSRSSRSTDTISHSPLPTSYVGSNYHANHRSSRLSDLQIPRVAESGSSKPTRLLRSTSTRRLSDKPYPCPVDCSPRSDRSCYFGRQPVPPPLSFLVSHSTSRI